MHRETVTLNTRWGLAQAVRIRQGAAKLAVFFPGQNYACNQPVLHFVHLAALAQGWDTLTLEYGYQATRQSLAPERLADIIDDTLAAVRQEEPGRYATVAFVGKSLGTYVALSVAQALGTCVRGHVLLTPVPRILPYLTDTRALVVAGDADPVLPPPARNQLLGLRHIDTILVPGADHALEIPGHWEASLRALETSTQASAAFLAHLGGTEVSSA